MLPERTRLPVSPKYLRPFLPGLSGFLAAPLVSSILPAFPASLVPAAPPATTSTFLVHPRCQQYRNPKPEVLEAHPPA